MKVTCSVEHARFVSRNHVFDVDESILTTMHLKQFQGLLNQVSKIVSLSLTVVNFIAKVGVFSLEEVHDWQDLSVVWNECFANSVRAGNQSLQDLESDRDDLWVSCIQGSFDWDNQLRDYRQNFGSSLLEHVKYSLYGKESVWIHLLSDAFKENRQVVVIVKLLDFDFPIDFVLWAMFNCNGQITAIIE